MSRTHRAKHSKSYSFEVCNRYRSKKGMTFIKQISALAHDESVHVLTMIVGSPIDGNLAGSEEPTQRVQGSLAAGTLDDDELMSDLDSGSVALSIPSAWLADETNGEATFSVYEASDPADPDQPFLLIVRTDRIVTVHPTRIGRVPDGYTGFPAYSRMLITTLLP